jgi:hypothetical protein
MKKLVLAMAIVALTCGCSRPPSSVIIVTVNPVIPPNIDQGQTLQFTAGLADDATHAGVAWTATGPGCAGASCGTFTNVTSTSALYNAPAKVSTNLAITVTATSVAQPVQIGFSKFNVMPPPSIVSTNLPAATPNQVYKATLQAAGGVPPLNWSVASGTLPAGLSLNGAGEINGEPTAGGTSTFTLKVTDSSTAPSGAMSTQQNFSLTVVNLLTIPATTFPSGTVGVGYNATVGYSGGLVPVTWSVYYGSLPAGLVLQQSSGVISGIPTVQGTFSFQLEVVDSSPVQQYFISPTLTITINPSGPLTIRTSSLLDGIVDTPYTGQLVATGGLAPLAWTVTAGAMPTGLTLNATTGAITGSPTATPGTYPFTAHVTDASSPQQAASQQLSITVDAAAAACSSSGNNSLLVGQYAFDLRGFNGSGFLAVVGSFTADGNGNITTGEADTNGGLGAQNGNLIPSASSYSVGPDNRGCATLATPFGTFYTRFAVGDISSGVATQGRIIEFDNPGASAYIASGQILQQASTAFVNPLTGGYDLRTSGWDSSTGGRVACVGIVTGSKYKFSSLEEDCNDNGAVTNTNNTYPPTNTLLNTYTTADTNGRGTGIITTGQNTSYLTFYWVSPTQLFMLNADPGVVFSGDWVQQNVPFGQPAFNQSAFNGTVAAYSNGLEPSGAGGEATFATETANGNSSVLSQLYSDQAGTWLNSSTTCTYTVVGVGRITLGGSNCGAAPSIPYLNAFNSSFFVGTDSSVELGSFEPQTTGLTNDSMAGTYYVGTSEVVSQAAQAEVGILTLTPNGILTTATDISSTVSQNTGVAGSDTLSVNPNGTFSTGSSGGVTVGIAISGSKFTIVDNPTLTIPTLLIAQQ